MPILEVDYPFQGHFIGHEGARVQEIKQACYMGDHKDPFIYLQDHEAPANPEDSSFTPHTIAVRAMKKRKTQQFGSSFDSCSEPCPTGDSGSSSECRTP